MSKILVVNQHGSNRGDEAACRAMLYGLKRFIPDAEFTILALHLPLCLDGVENVTLMENLPLRGLKGGKAARRILQYIVSFYTGLNATPYMKEVFAAFRQADLIISAPAGPYVGDLYIWSEIEMLFHILLGTLTASPVMIYAPSMGPFQRKRRNRWRRLVLKRVDLITLRESISAEYLGRLGICLPPEYITIDSVLQRPVDAGLGDSVFAREGLERNKMYIGFAPSLGLKQFRDDDKKVQYIELLVQAMRLFVDQFDARFIFFPHGYGAWRDRPFIESIVSIAGMQHRAHILSETSNSNEQQALAGKLDAFVSFRYHPGMFALRQFVPCVSVAYQHKVRGFMHALGMEEFCLDLDTLTPSQLVEKIRQAIEKREETTQRVRPQLELLERESLKNSFLASLLLEYQSQPRRVSLDMFVGERLNSVKWWDI